MPSMNVQRMAEFLISGFQESPRMRLTSGVIHVTHGFEMESLRSAFTEDAPLHTRWGDFMIDALEIPRKNAQRERGIIFAGGIFHPKGVHDKAEPAPVVLCNVD